MNVYIAPGHLV